MALSVIGAGFGRTGTTSMKKALEILGFGPCHHMFEVNASTEQKRIWRTAAASGEPPDFEDAFRGYHSAVDWPSAYYWRETTRYYPAAKVILTVRDADSWYASMEKTVLRVIQSSTERESVGVALVGERVFGGNFDREHAIAVYERNTREVQAAFSGDRLLTYETGSGWEPLCAFLDQPIPDVPYPHTNSSEEFNQR